MTGNDINVEDFRQALLKWYDKARRPLPWRAPKGKFPDPYHVWLSEIMAQQTTIPAVIPYFLKFLDKWPTVHDLANATPDDVMQNWAGLGYYARARNLHKCAVMVSKKLDGKFPQTQNELEELPGIGNYTANAIAALAFGRPANVVDANVERVMARIFAVTEPLPDSKPELKRLAGTIALAETKRAGDYAQSVMELGALVCTPTSPKCGICPVNAYCRAKAIGIQNELPARKEKGIKPQKHGYIYWITGPKGEILFERRNEKGMLGGTIGIPTSDWVERSQPRKHLALGSSGKAGKVLVKHSFTHFDLELHGFAVILKDTKTIKEERYFWVPHKEAANLGIPTLFKKALKQFIE